jgi:hypothetical protein
MAPRKRSHKGKKSASSVIHEEDTENLQGSTTGLDKLIAWLEDFDMQCNFVVLIGNN